MTKSRYENGMPGATDLISLLDKGWIEFWVKSKGFDHCEEVKQDSIGIGKRVHTNLEKYLHHLNGHHGKIEHESDQEETMFANGVEWIQQVGLKPKLIEREGSFYHPTLEINGTPDVVGEIDDKMYIFDWKTDSNPKPGQHERTRELHYKLQGAAYYMGVQDVHGIQVEGMYFVRVAKDLSRTVYFYTKDQLRGHCHTVEILRNVYREIHNK